MKKIVALVLSLALVLALGTVAFATAGDTYYTKTTEKNPATASDVVLTYHKAAEPTVNKDGEQTEQGNIAYYSLSSNEKAYVAVDSLAKADLVVYSDEAMKNVVLYLDEVKDPTFFDAKVYTNFGDKCGQFDYAGYDKDVTYYIVNGKDLYAGSKTGEESLRVAGKLVTVNPLNVVIKLEGHAAVPVLEGAKVVGYKCANCGLAAVEAPNYASIPEKNGGIIAGNWYWPAAAAAAATTTGVTSAKTFDAGVAMYAGLALMSVAGSAVVIGKKKEF